MNIISQFYNILEKNFNNFLKNYFNQANYWIKDSNIDNYTSFMMNIDSFNTSFITNIIKYYFEYIDDIFFKSNYRKQFCSSKGLYKRTILTMFGEITYQRRYYFDKSTNERFFFTDYFFNLPKRKYFDPFICSEVINEAASSNYSKTGKIIASKIGNRINNNIYISRASARNIVMNFNISNDIELDDKKVERLYVMLDEKFVGSQFNSGKDHMIKGAVIFEGTELEYKYKKKPDSIDRYRLVNSHTCASIDNELLSNTVDYIYNTYNTDYLNEIIFMGDCATWIKNFPKSYWFKFNKNTNVKFAMDGFHFSQAINQLTTLKHIDVRNALLDIVKNNDKNNFISLCNEFKDLYPGRVETIESKENYILNNWNERQLYQNNPYMKCSMESHISHLFADIFTSRPKAYSKNGLRQLLKLRLLKINNKDIKKMYFDSFKEMKSNINIQINDNYNNFYYNSNQFDFLYRDTTAELINLI